MKIKLFLGAILMSTLVQAQDFLTQIKPEGSKEWGYMNENGEVVIEPNFRKCYEFSEDGYAAIFLDDKLVIINASGEQKMVAGDRLALIQGKEFSDGLLGIKNRDKKVGFVNTEGQVAIDMKYDEATFFDQGYALASKNGVTYVLDASGNEVQAKFQGEGDLKPFQEGLSPFRDASDKWGFINNTGEIQIAAKFSGVGYFSNGLAWARDENGIIGYINKTGEWAIEPKFTVGKEFDPVSGMARVKMGDNWMYTDASGTLLTMSDSDKWEDFSDGLAMGRKGEMVGFFDKDGNWAISPLFEAARDFKNGYAAVRLNGKWGFIDKTGEVVIPCKYAAVKDMEKASK